MRPFRLHEPTTVQEAVAVLHELGESARLYAGGTELLLAMKTGLLEPDDLVNVKTIAGFGDIALDDDTLVIGAGATHREVEESAVVRERLPQLAEVEHTVANNRVRNVGTLAGNLCFAEPHSDPATLLLLFDAEVDVVGPDGARRIPLAALQVGPYETTLAPDEILVSIRVPASPSKMGGAYAKFGYHHRPTLGVGVVVQTDQGRITDVRLSLGCVPPVATRLPEAEAVLMGQRIDALGDGSALLAEAGRLAAGRAEAVGDMHGSASYKEHLVGVFIGRVFARALALAEAS